MKLDKLEYPFSELYKHGYIIIGPNGRKNVCLADKASDAVTTISYARYLMSIKLGRFLTREEEVDHIDNDPTNDSIDNLQMLSGEANRNKFFALRDAQHEHGTMYWYRKGCKCVACVEAARIYSKEQREKAKARKAAGILPKAPEERYPIKAAEKRLGRSLSHGECFWHLDGDSNNNTEENLIIFKTFLDRRRFKAQGANTELLIKNQDGTCSVSYSAIQEMNRKTHNQKYQYTCAQCKKAFYSDRKRKSGLAFCCLACCNHYRALHNASKCPDISTLIKDFETQKAFRNVGKLYGVSDNTVKKWCIRLGILDRVQPIINNTKKETLKKNQRPKTEEERAKMIDNLKLYWAGHTHSTAISVEQLDPVTGDVIAVYSSMREAARAGFIDHCIAKCCKDGTRQHKGFKWRYHIDDTVTETT